MPYAHPEAWSAPNGWPGILATRRSGARRLLQAPRVTPTAREDYQRGHIPGAVFFDIDDVAQPGTACRT